MERIEQISNYLYFKKFHNSIEPINEEDEIFKARLGLLLFTLEEQTQALNNIDDAMQEEHVPQSKPKLRLIHGGE